jgi:DNA-binding LacI/PurR family transcriptional regulator
MPEKPRILYGKKIVPHHMLNYAEQIYDILVGEIEQGRWDINERLPGVISLARDLGFGTKTVQTAYNRLKEDGYVTTRGYRGTYLKSRHPNEGAMGKIGVLVSEEQTGQALILWYEHVILEHARRSNLVTQVKVMPSGMDPAEVARKSAVFSDDVAGIISLTAFRTALRYADTPDALPLVFLCPPFEQAAPRVSADVQEAYYDLTSRLIRCGHTRIVFSEDSIEPDPRQTRMHREGYMQAMQDHGLDVDHDVIKASRKVNNDEPDTVIRHIREIAELDEAKRPTAVVAGSLGRSMVLTRLAPRKGISIPQDLSIVSIGSAHIDGDKDRRITGMLPDFDRMIALCMELLEQQREDGKSNIAHIHVRMHYLPGDTLRSLNDANLENNGAAELNGHDIRDVSRAVQYRATDRH